jgi:hypothetical protein
MEYYWVFILRAYQTSGELLSISYRETVWQSPANWRSFIRWTLDQCSLAPPSVTEASCYCALFCVFMARLRYNSERVFIYDYVKTNSYKSCRRKFCRKFPDTTCLSGDNNFQISEESLNAWHSNWQKAIKKKLYFNWGKTWWHRSLIRKFSLKIFAAISVTKWCSCRQCMDSN